MIKTESSAVKVNPALPMIEMDQLRKHYSAKLHNYHHTTYIGPQIDDMDINYRLFW